MKKKHISINMRMKLIGYAMIAPLLLLVAYLLYSLISFGDAYNQSVRNVSVANDFSLEFKNDIDYSMYLVVARSVSVADLEEELKDTVIECKDPYKLIEDARKTFSRLSSNTTGSGNQKRIRSILRYLDNLETGIKEIDTSIAQTGHYDENMLRLDNNIRILTQLTQEQIQQYIYYEAAHLETVRIELMDRQEQDLQISLIFMVAVILIITIMTAAMSRSVSRPIKKLVETTELVARGDFAARVESREGDEISALTDSFNSMAGRIGELVNNIKAEQLMLRDTELKLLQAQINPHFLYNTLDTIIWLAEGKRNDEVVEMVSSLSDFFRTTLSEGRDYITIKEEESHIRSYLEIQQFRYRDIMEYEIHIPEELGDYSILKLTLQPLVENALYHGVKNKRGMGKITVLGEKQEDKILLAVEDNGIGMDGDTLERLRKRVKGNVGDGEGNFGLTNVDERIRLRYGKEYGLRIFSQYQQGTRVEVLLPAKQYTEMISEDNNKILIKV